MKTNTIGIVVIIISIITYYVYGFLDHNGAFKKIHDLNNESCHRIKSGGKGMLLCSVLQITPTYIVYSTHILTIAHVCADYDRYGRY